MKPTTATKGLAAPTDQKETAEQAAGLAIAQANDPANIAKLAYALWEYRGGQAGSSEQDWFEAERQLARPTALGAASGG